MDERDVLAERQGLSVAGAELLSKPGTFGRELGCQTMTMDYGPVPPIEEVRAVCVSGVQSDSGFLQLGP